MTQRPADVPSLPLSVTCTPDVAFGETIVALATRVAGGGAGGSDVTAGAQRFADAVQLAVQACLTQLGSDSSRTLFTELSSDQSHWLCDLRWTAEAEGAGTLAGLESTLTALADVVECGHDGREGFCALRCRRD